MAGGGGCVGGERCGRARSGSDFEVEDICVVEGDEGWWAAEHDGGDGIERERSRRVGEGIIWEEDMRGGERERGREGGGERVGNTPRRLVYREMHGLMEGRME